MHGYADGRDLPIGTGGKGMGPAIAEALARGLARFRTFLGARTLDAQAIAEPGLRRRVATATDAP